MLAIETLSYSPTLKERTKFIPIQEALTQSRDNYVSQEQKRAKIVVAYELGQDAVVYQELARHKNEQGYDSASKSLNAYIKMQLETHIGERLHVGISKLDHQIKDGQIWPENIGEPMLKMMKRGRGYRWNIGKPVDFARESAEVFGFEQIQSVLVNESTPEGTMMLSISPQGDIKNGSIYTKNFYDVYQKTKDGIASYRFTSGLTPNESQQKVKQFDKRYYVSQVPHDHEFLSQPIKLDPNTSFLSTPQEVHDYMHKAHEHMNYEEFKRVVEACAPFITSYINNLCENPHDNIQQERIFNALLNYADIAAGKVQGGVIFQNDSYVRLWIPSPVDIQLLSNMPVRHVSTGCGSSGSSIIGNTSSSGYLSQFSVVESSTGLSIGNEWFKCPKCTYKASGPIGERPCPGCGLTKEAYAAESGISCD